MTPTCPQCGDDLDPYFNVCHGCVGAIVVWLDNPSASKIHWRVSARDVMRFVVKKYRNAHETIDADELIRFVDDAYPFGMRAMAPYKAWLAERKELIAVLKPEKLPPPPTVQDYAACEVAIDLVEMGREDEARAILDEQAPRRLNLKCPVCGAKAGKACFDAEAGTAAVVIGVGHINGSKVPVTICQRPKTTRRDRVVPHLVRVGLTQPAPLFERSQP